MTGAARPERGAVLELRELLDEIDALASEGDRTRYDEDRRYRWVIHYDKRLTAAKVLNGHEGFWTFSGRFPTTSCALARGLYPIKPFKP